MHMAASNLKCLHSVALVPTGLLFRTLRNPRGVGLPESTAVKSNKRNIADDAQDVEVMVERDRPGVT